jgi:hypothetical protein
MYRSPFFATFYAGTEVEETESIDTHAAGDLVHHVQTLTRNVFDLQLVVAALIETLHKIELADPAKLRETVEVELANVRETLHTKHQARLSAIREERRAADAAALAGQPGPGIGHAPRQGNATCARCGAVVPAGRTTITASGTVCDQCAAKLPA